MKYDLIAIGAGSGGLSVVERAAEYGKKCLVIENKKIGGACVNVGCVPKKIMWFAANTLNTINNSSGFGINNTTYDFSWQTLKNNRDNYIKNITNWYDKHLQKLGVHYIQGNGSLVNTNTVLVNGKQYSAKHIVLAPGTTPFKDSIKGADFGIDSDEFFTLDKLPQKVAIIGSGYIAIEFAGVLNSLGVKVEIFARSNEIMHYFDKTIKDILENSYQQQGIIIHNNIHITSITDNKTIHTDKIAYTGFDTIIWAIGRKPLTDNLKLDNANIKLDNNGFIIVDKYQTTNVANIYAIGDITNKVPLTPVAIKAGRYLADRLFNNMPNRYLDYHNIPTVLFSHPPVATIGFTEEKAREKFNDIVVYVSDFTPMSDALLKHQSTTALKLICSGDEQKIIGCHIIGHGADEMMQGFAVAINMGATKDDFDNTVAIHPTSSEELVTMR